MNKVLYASDRARIDDDYRIGNGRRIDSKVEFYNSSGELIWEPLHNKTVIAGSALTAMKLFNLDRHCLDNTPTYDNELNLIEKSVSGSYPTINVVDGNNNIIGSMQDESQRIILGFCVGQGGAGLDISDVRNVEYASWITPDNLVPFRCIPVNNDDVDEEMYKGKKLLHLSNGDYHAYYFKAFSNTPDLVQSYVSTIGNFSDVVSPSNVYSSGYESVADKAQSYVELHLKITNNDCREFFIAGSGLENAKINQISLVSGWTKTVTVNKLNQSGSVVEKDVEYFQDIRPFSIINIPNEILSSREKSISCIYTLYF